mgnify:CR=1 FL=1
MPFFSLRYGFHQTYDSKSLEWARVYFSGHRLLYQVSGSCFVQEHYLGGNRPFLKQNIIYRYSVLGELIIDNGKNLNGKMIEQLCQQFKIEHRNLVPYHPQMNGVVEVADKNIKKILMKMTDTYKDWHEYCFLHCVLIVILYILPRMQPRILWFMAWKPSSQPR